MLATTRLGHKQILVVLLAVTVVRVDFVVIAGGGPADPPVGHTVIATLVVGVVFSMVIVTIMPITPITPTVLVRQHRGGSARCAWLRLPSNEINEYVPALTCSLAEGACDAVRGPQSGCWWSHGFPCSLPAAPTSSHRSVWQRNVR